MPGRLVVVGASGHGEVVADVARLAGYREVLFLDDDPARASCGGWSVVGRLTDAARFADGDTEFFAAVGSPSARMRVLGALEGLPLATLVHPSAVVARGVGIGAGSVVMAGAVVNPGTGIGRGCIVNTGATVDHDNVIEDLAHVSVGAHTAGSVRVGRGTWLGIGSVVSNGVSVCGGCMVGAGAVVVRDIAEPGTYVGVPVRKVNDRNLLGGGG